MEAEELELQVGTLIQALDFLSGKSSQVCTTSIFFSSSSSFLTRLCSLLGFFFSFFFFFGTKIAYILDSLNYRQCTLHMQKCCVFILNRIFSKIKVLSVQLSLIHRQGIHTLIHTFTYLCVLQKTRDSISFAQ